MRQVADEAHRVRQQHLSAARKLNRAELGIERSEHARGLEDACTRNRVEQCAFPGVGIAHEGNGGDRDRFATPALLGADAPDGLQFAAQLQHAALNAAPIRLELCFTGSARADAAAELGHSFAAAGQPGQHVFELRQFYLELAFARSRMAGENIQDELGAVDDPAGQRVLQVAQLGWAQIVVDDGNICLRRSRDPGDLFHFAAAHERRRVGFGTMLHNLGRNAGPGADDQLAELRKARVLVGWDRVWAGSYLGRIARLGCAAGQRSPLRPKNDRDQQCPFRGRTGRVQRH